MGFRASAIAAYHRKCPDCNTSTASYRRPLFGLPDLGIALVAIPSFRPPPQRVDWDLLSDAFRQDVEAYFDWCAGADVFAADARQRPLAPRTRKLRRDEIHAAATALIASGVAVATIRSLADLVAEDSFRRILRRRHDAAGGKANSFNHALAKALIQIAREWVRVDVGTLDKLKKMTAKLPQLSSGLVDRNKRFLRQFDDPAAFARLVNLPQILWSEVRRDARPNFRTLAKAQAAIAIALLTYIPLRSHNLVSLTFDTHLFLNDDVRATSTLELAGHEVKNGSELAFDIPPVVGRMLIEYRDRVAPNIIGHRPERLFENVDGSPKSQAGVAWLISTNVYRRTGIEIAPHQFRHLSARVRLDAEPGNFEGAKQLLGHKSLRTTVAAYAGIDSRRAARHHQRLIDQALESAGTGATRRSSRPQHQEAGQALRQVMRSSANEQLPYGDWPAEDRSSWEAAFRAGEFLDEEGAGAHLAPKSRAALKAAYGRFLRFVIEPSASQPRPDAKPNAITR